MVRPIKTSRSAEIAESEPVLQNYILQNYILQNNTSAADFLDKFSSSTFKKFHPPNNRYKFIE
jgi:hypothetical protein